MRRALILIDIQNDFLPPNGALAVPAGNNVIAVANRLKHYFDRIIATQDWHPANHQSFAANHPNQQVGNVMTWQGLPQILWPVHCVQNTSGADFPAALNIAKINKIIYKGTNPDIDSYSAFFDNAHRQQTDLAHYLNDHDINIIYLMGLATDYCVKYSVLDAIALGYETHVLLDGCQGIDLVEGDVDRAVLAMKNAGAYIENSHLIFP